MTPYCLFLCAEHFEYSGVMAVVSGGLFMSYRAHEAFGNGHTRLNMLGVWTTLIFLMNALVFILIGLELPDIVSGLGESSISQGINYGIIISILVIVLRFIWVYFLSFFSNKIKPDNSALGLRNWKEQMILSWAGMRGVVSLATALSIPLWLDNGTLFPHRNLIIFITFVVIFITLVFQGLTIPYLIKALKIDHLDEETPEVEQ